MTRVAVVVVAVAVVVGAGVYVAGCSRNEAPAPGTGPVGPTGPVGAGGPVPTAVFTYVCPDHADQKSPTPAKCPTCGKPMKADTAEPVEYFCPMHPDVVQSEPGECAKCGGMPLQARPAGGVAPPGGDEKTEPVTPPTEEKGAEPSAPEKGEAGTT